MDTFDPNYLRPMCPYCVKGNGNVRAVTVRAHEKTLTYRCEACERRWQMAYSDPQPTTVTADGLKVAV